MPFTDMPFNSPPLAFLTQFSLSLVATHCDWMHFHTEITKNDASLINADGKTASRRGFAAAPEMKFGKSVETLLTSIVLYHQSSQRLLLLCAKKNAIRPLLFLFYE